MGYVLQADTMDDKVCVEPDSNIHDLSVDVANERHKGGPREYSTGIDGDYDTKDGFDEVVNSGRGLLTVVRRIEQQFDSRKDVAETTDERLERVD